MQQIINFSFKLLQSYQFKGTQRLIALYNPFTDYSNHFQNISSVTNQSNGSTDNTFMLNTRTTGVPVLSGFFLSPLTYADSYSLSSTNNYFFQTNTT